MAEDVAHIPGPTGRPRPTRLGGNLCRRQLCPGGKRGASVGKTTRGKGTKWMAVVDGQGIPVGNLLDAASPADVTLLEPTLDTIAVPRNGPGRPRKKPERVIYDKACDSDPLRKRLARRGIEPLIPARRNHKRVTHHDGRKLRRYRRRWIVEHSHLYYPSPDNCRLSYDWPAWLIASRHRGGQVPAPGRGRERKRMSTAVLPPRP
jgi:hypothetical protein